MHRPPIRNDRMLQILACNLISFSYSALRDFLEARTVICRRDDFPIANLAAITILPAVMQCFFLSSFSSS